VAKVIVAENLTVIKDDRKILQEISFTIAAGRWTCLVGPNGAGKTSLLKAILGNSRYDGSLSIDGVERHKDQSINVAYVPQIPSIPQGMSVWEYANLGRAKIDGWGRHSAAGTQLVEEILEQTNLSSLRDQHISRLSGGELQRALIARALAQEPELILLDEPTSALDLHHQIAVLDNIELLKSRGVTIVSTMHDITLAAMYADDLVIMQDGQILLTGASGAVIHSPELKRAFENRINVFTLDSGRPVVVAEKNQRT